MPGVGRELKRRQDVKPWWSLGAIQKNAIWLRVKRPDELEWATSGYRKCKLKGEGMYV